MDLITILQCVWEGSGSGGSFGRRSEQSLTGIFDLLIGGRESRFGGGCEPREFQHCLQARQIDSDVDLGRLAEAFESSAWSPLF